MLTVEQTSRLIYKKIIWIKWWIYKRFYEIGRGANAEFGRSVGKCVGR